MTRVTSSTVPVRFTDDMDHVYAELSCLRLAIEQHGVISRLEALALGMTDEAIRHRLETGQWAQLYAGVYAPPVAADGWLTSLNAARLAAGRGTVAFGRSAAALHELDLPAPHMVELGAVTKRRAPGTDVLIHCCRPLPASHITTVKGISVTTVARTLCEVGRFVSLGRLERCLDDAPAGGKVTTGEIRSAYEVTGTRGRRGPASARLLVEEREVDPVELETKIEAALRTIVAHLPLPAPEFQWTHIFRDGSEASIDFYWPNVSLGLEADSRRWHTSKSRWEHDLRRDNRLKAEGITILRFTWIDATARRGEIGSVILDTYRRLEAGLAR